MPIIVRIYSIPIIVALIMEYNIIAVDIIIDLGGVLLKTDKSLMANKVGMMNLMGYTFTHFKSPRKDFYTFLDHVKPIIQESKARSFAYDERHRKLPCVMCEWLKGVPSRKILKRVSKAHPSPLNLKLAQAVFDPEVMSKSKLIIQSGVNFVQECCRQGHNMYILANQDPESFEILKKNNPDFFNLFTGIVISGDCALVKPDPAIFKYLLKTYNLEVNNCFFIDDQQENIETAQKLGITSCKVNSKRAGPNFKKVRSVLNKWIKTVGSVKTASN